MPAAAVYARKSTEQNVADQEKSVTRQIELAVACAKTHGFEVAWVELGLSDMSNLHCFGFSSSRRDPANDVFGISADTIDER